MPKRFHISTTPKDIAEAPTIWDSTAQVHLSPGQLVDQTNRLLELYWQTRDLQESADRALKNANAVIDAQEDRLAAEKAWSARHRAELIGLVQELGQALAHRDQDLVHELFNTVHVVAHAGPGEQS